MGYWVSKKWRAICPRCDKVVAQSDGKQSSFGCPNCRGFVVHERYEDTSPLDTSGFMAFLESFNDSLNNARHNRQFNKLICARQCGWSTYSINCKCGAVIEGICLDPL